MSGTAEAVEEAVEAGAAEVAVRWESGGGVTKKSPQGCKGHKEVKDTLKRARESVQSAVNRHDDAICRHVPRPLRGIQER
jgi:hypothetical protein